MASPSSRKDRRRLARLLRESGRLSGPDAGSRRAKAPVDAFAVAANALYVAVLLAFLALAWSMRRDVAESRARMEASVSRMETAAPASVPASMPASCTGGSAE